MELDELEIVVSSGSGGGGGCIWSFFICRNKEAGKPFDLHKDLLGQYELTSQTFLNRCLNWLLRGQRMRRSVEGVACRWQ